jgi:hypothetical protein
MLLWFLGGSSFLSDVAGFVGSGCVLLLVAGFASWSFLYVCFHVC